VRVYGDEDADLDVLGDECVAVLGYGIQGRAQALNLRDSGIEVVVGNRDDDYAGRARDDGFEVLEIEAAAARGDTVLLLIPDEAQQEVWNAAVEEAMEPGDAVVFAHGFALRYRLVEPPAGLDVLMLAPRMPGRHVRGRYVSGAGVPAWIDVVNDATGRAWPRLLALARGIGATRAGALELDAGLEAELDLFSEHFTFPLVFRTLEVAFEVLVDAGYPPEAAVMELHGSGELGMILEEAARVGLYGMLERDGSPAARFGVLRNRAEVLDAEELRERARGSLERIRDGSFARELLEDQRSGHPELEEMSREVQGTEMSRAEACLRRLLGHEE